MPSLEAVEGYRYALNIEYYFGGMINILSNKSIMTSGFTSFSVSVMNSSVNDYRKPLLNRMESIQYLFQSIPHAQLK